jgi:hypothetical protein
VVDFQHEREPRIETRKRRSREEVKRLVAEFEASGLERILSESRDRAEHIAATPEKPWLGRRQSKGG